MNRFLLLGYSLVVTVALAAIVLAETFRPTSMTFDQITVHRINVVVPDGTPRMIISNRAAFPGMIVRGKEKQYNRPFAGMISYKDEDTKTGNLVFGGHKDAQGQVVDSGVSLSFDKYGAPLQIVQLAE